MRSVTSCTSNVDYADGFRWANKILNGGCVDFDDSNQMKDRCGIRDLQYTLSERCQRAQADYVFQFLGFIFSMAMIVLGWVLHRRSGTNVSRM
jgi:hypothetical protein